MITLQGRFFDGQTSKSRSATLAIYDDGQVRLSSNGVARSLVFGDLDVSPRVANTPRSIRLPDGGTFETLENDAVDAALEQFRLGAGSLWLHRLESRKGFIAASVAAVAAMLWALVQSGIPALAESAAFALPASTRETIGIGVLDALDRTHLDASDLESEEQKRIQGLFLGVIPENSDTLDFRLLFRKGGSLGANALALPSGVVIVTDELVDVAEEDGEIVAVLAHELGHVVRRHAMRQVIQNSLVAMLVIVVTGDLSSTSSIVAAVPTLLVEARLSQEFEREADSHALDHLRRYAIDPAHFANLMHRLAPEPDADESVTSFFSTHPATAERIRMFENASSRIEAAGPDRDAIGGGPAPEDG